jgi:hypothetical protein
VISARSAARKVPRIARSLQRIGAHRLPALDERAAGGHAAATGNGATATAPVFGPAQTQPRLAASAPTWKRVSRPSRDAMAAIRRVTVRALVPSCRAIAWSL